MEPGHGQADAPAAIAADRLADALQQSGNGEALVPPELDRPFFTWYWSLMSAE
jgi:hypothetical protein